MIHTSKELLAFLLLIQQHIVFFCCCCCKSWILLVLKSLRVLISARLRHDTEHCPSVDSNKRGSCFMYKNETHGHSMMCINII